MKRVEMIGTPVDHVETPGLLNPIFHANGDQLELTAVDVGAGDLLDYVSRARLDASAAGLVVTTPLKQAICRYLDQWSATVDLTGACNCVRFDGRRWIGANFDGHGFHQALCQAIDPRSVRSVLIVGCGGAGGAIAARLATPGVDLAIYDVEATKAFDLERRLHRLLSVTAVTILSEPLGEFDLVINASPLGMNPDDPSPIPDRTLASAKILADIVTAEQTTIKRMAEHLGKPLVGGKAMVAGQVLLMRRFLISGDCSE